MSEPSEVCIVGAGITGLNALVVASSYLRSTDTVVLVDSRARSGGMWVDTYDYVRLHQPHPIFTAGNIKWTLDQKPNHLATKREILDHLQRCLEVARKRVDLEEHYGWIYVSHVEADGLVHVTFRSPEGGDRTVVTRRLIKAFGHAVRPNPPLATTSDRVRSTTPELLDLSDPELRDGNAPIWIVGSGKTAMDAAHLLVTELPGRRVSMLAGPGTIFARRDAFFPTGAQRWWGGTPINTAARQVANRFDGTNEAEVRDWYRATYGITPTPDAKDFFSAYLSESELEVITAGLDAIEMEYFTDAVDRDEGVELLLRSGRSLPAPAGTWLVNCTGSLLRSPHPYEPFVSDTGTTLSLQMRSIQRVEARTAEVPAEHQVGQVVAAERREGTGRAVVPTASPDDRRDPVTGGAPSGAGAPPARPRHPCGAVRGPRRTADRCGRAYPLRRGSRRQALRAALRGEGRDRPSVRCARPDPSVLQQHAAG